MKEKSMDKDLFIADISFDAEEEDLRKLFSVCGTVRSVNMITDKQSGLFKGCAFVRMATAPQAKEALNMLDGTRLINRCISVTAARPMNSAGPAQEAAPEKAKKPRRPRGKRR